MQGRFFFLLGLVFSTTLIFKTLVFTVPETQAAPKPKKEDQPLKKVTAKVLELQEVYDSLVYPARVESRIHAKVLSETPGKVEGLQVTLGQQVKKGEILLEVRHTDPVYEFAKVKVRAPVDGVVSRIDVAPGDYVEKGQNLVAVLDPDQLQIVVQVPAIDVPSLQIGLTGEFKDIRTEQPISVKVVGMSSYVDPGTGTVRAELGSTDKTLPQGILAGTLGRVSFKVNERESLLVPSHSVIYRGKKTFIRRLESGDVSKKVEVTLGPKKKGMVEVVKGLSAKDRIIERTNDYIPDGQKVQVQSLESEEATGKTKSESGKTESS